MFVSGNEKTDNFLRMMRLLEFLKTSSKKEEKIRKIKKARDDGLINEDEAIELTIEFC